MNSFSLFHLVQVDNRKSNLKIIFGYLEMIAFTKRFKKMLKFLFFLSL